MRKFFAAAVLAFALYAAPAYFAQSVVPQNEIPQEKVADAAKPFIGKWAAVSCETNIIGVRFSIRVGNVPDQDNGVRQAPVFKVEGAQGVTMDPFDFQTNSFATDFDGVLTLQVENDGLGLITLRQTKKQGKIVTSLTGEVVNFSQGSDTLLFAVPDTFKTGNWDYVTPLSTMCPKADSNDDVPQARLLKAASQVIIAGAQKVSFTADETPEEQAAALSELTKFAQARGLLGAYRDGSKDGTYDVAMFVTDKDGNVVGDDPKWVVYGAATLTEGVKQIESDYTTYPDGHNVPDEGGKA